MAETKEILEKLQEQGAAFEEFKKKNDELLAAKAEGKAVGDLTAAVTKLQEVMSKLDTEMLEIQKKAKRPQVETDDKAEQAKKLDAALRYFGLTGDNRELRAMNTADDTEGGYLVLPYLDPEIDRVVGTLGGFASVARTIPVNTDKYEKLVKTAGMTAAWVAPGATNGEVTEPTYAQVKIDNFPAEVEPWVYQETLDDARIDLAADLTNEAATGFSELFAGAFITGDGVGKPRGITKYTMVANASYAWGKVGYIVSGKSAAFASSAPSDNVISLQHALKSQYRSNAVFLCNDATLGTMRQLKDGSGTYYLWNPDPTAGFGGRFLGSPVKIDDNMPDIGAASYSLAYGDMARAYVITPRSGIAFIRDNITAKGKVKFNFRKRIGGGIVMYEAIKFMKFATS